MTMVATYTTINTHVRILFPFPILFIIARNEWPGSYSMPFLLELHSCIAAFSSFSRSLTLHCIGTSFSFVILDSFFLPFYSNVFFSLSFCLPGCRFYFWSSSSLAYLWILCSCLFYAFQGDNFDTQLEWILNIHLHRLEWSDIFQLISPCCCSTSCTCMSYVLPLFHCPFLRQKIPIFTISFCLITDLIFLRFCFLTFGAPSILSYTCSGLFTLHSLSILPRHTFALSLSYPSFQLILK